MSVLLMGLVWNSTIRDRTQLDVLLYLANCADDDGTNCFPSVERTANYVRCSARTVTRTVADLTKENWIEITERGDGRGNVSQFVLNMEKLKGCQDVTLSKWGKRVTIRTKRVTPTTIKGDNDATPPHPLIGRPTNDPSEDPSVPSPAAQSKKRKGGTPDPRHTPFRENLAAYWKSKNPAIEMPWGKPEAGALGMVLSASPDLTVEQFRHLLHNRWKSEVNHSDRPCRWLHGVLSYANGPVDRFGKPLKGASNGTGSHTKAARTINAGLEAVERIENRIRANRDGDEAPGGTGLEEHRTVGGRIIDATLPGSNGRD